MSRYGTTRRAIRVEPTPVTREEYWRGYEEKPAEDAVEGDWVDFFVFYALPEPKWIDRRGQTTDDGQEVLAELALSGRRHVIGTLSRREDGALTVTGDLIRVGDEMGRVVFDPDGTVSSAIEDLHVYVKRR